MADNSAFDALKGLLGENADEKINTVLNSLAPAKSEDGEENTLSLPSGDSIN